VQGLKKLPIGQKLNFVNHLCGADFIKELPQEYETMLSETAVHW
jgi:hypothetical protein